MWPKWIYATGLKLVALESQCLCHWILPNLMLSLFFISQAGSLLTAPWCADPGHAVQRVWSPIQATGLPKLLWPLSSACLQPGLPQPICMTVISFPFVLDIFEHLSGRWHDFLSFPPQQPSFTSSGSCSSMSDPGLGTGGWSIGTETWGVNRGTCLPSGLGFRWLLWWGKKGVSTGCDCCQSSFLGFGQRDVTPWLEVNRACSNCVNAPAVLPLLTSVACCPTGLWRNCYKHPRRTKLVIWITG